MEPKRNLNTSGIFFDSANLAELKKWFSAHILGGATTNPLILQNEGVIDVPRHIQKMVDIVGPGFPISIELPDIKVTRDKKIDLAKKYNDMFPMNTVIKVAMDPRKPEAAYEVIYRLGQAGVRVNATLGLSFGQLAGAAEAMRYSHVDGNYISLFWARRDEAKRQIEAETGVESPDAATTLLMTINYLKIHNLSPKIIVGSIRNIVQIDQAFYLGADIVTIPPKFIQAWMYTKRGVETLEEFNKGYQGVKKMKLI